LQPFKVYLNHFFFQLRLSTTNRKTVTKEESQNIIKEQLERNPNQTKIDQKIRGNWSLNTETLDIGVNLRERKRTIKTDSQSQSQEPGINITRKRLVEKLNRTRIRARNSNWAWNWTWNLIPIKKWKQNWTRIEKWNYVGKSKQTHEWGTLRFGKNRCNTPFSQHINIIK
jgi:hypothetical protein